MVKPLALVAATVKAPLQIAVAAAGVALTIPPISWASDVTREILYHGIDGSMRVIARVTKDTSKNSPHLSGIYAPQPIETSEENARVSGEIPKDLKGMFVNVNPNPQFLPVGGYHIFEGDGSLTSVRLYEDGHASFSYTHLNTEKRRHEKSLGRSNELSIMAMRGYSGLVLMMMSMLKRKLSRTKYSRSAANTNIELNGQRVYALWEGGLPYELTMSKNGLTLQTKSQLKFAEYSGPFSAHPVNHSATGNWYSVSYMMESSEQDAAIVVLNAKSEFVREIPLHLGRKPMIHDAAVTENYVVVLDLPVLLTPEDMLKPEGGVIRSHSDKPGRIGLFPIDGTNENQIVWFEVPSCAAFHTLNAWETDDRVVLYMCQFPKFNIVSMNDIMDSKLTRYELHLSTGKVEITTTELGLDKKFGDSTFIDFPFVNPNNVGKLAKFGYGSILAPNQTKSDILNRGICKVNLETGEPEQPIMFDGIGLGEAGFVAKSNAVNEDDAYLLQFVKRDDGNTVMNIYDAVTMDTSPIASVHAPEGYHVPSGFHSQFIDSSSLNQLHAYM